MNFLLQILSLIIANAFSAVNAADQVPDPTLPNGGSLPPNSASNIAFPASNAGFQTANSASFPQPNAAFPQSFDQNGIPAGFPSSNPLSAPTDQTTVNQQFSFPSNPTTTMFDPNANVFSNIQFSGPFNPPNFAGNFQAYRPFHRPTICPIPNDEFDTRQLALNLHSVRDSDEENAKWTNKRGIKRERMLELLAILTEMSGEQRQMVVWEYCLQFFGQYFPRRIGQFSPMSRQYLGCIDVLLGQQAPLVPDDVGMLSKFLGKIAFKLKRKTDPNRKLNNGWQRHLKMSSQGRDLLRAMLEPKPIFDAKQLEGAFYNQKWDLVVEILWSRTRQDVNLLREGYKLAFGMAPDSLLVPIDHFLNEPQPLDHTLLMQLISKRFRNQTLAKAKLNVNEVAKDLIIHYRKKNYFQMLSKLSEFLVQVDNLAEELAQLSEILEANEKDARIWNLIQQCYEYDNRSAFHWILLKILAMAGQDWASAKIDQGFRINYFARQLFLALSNQKEMDHIEIIRQILSHSEENLAAIRDAYSKNIGRIFKHLEFAAFGKMDFFAGLRGILRGNNQNCGQN